ncbi:MAG TPA: iron-sulfur cluster assembly protein [Tepidiformaceae bacterium]|nr:iron-sulfur cluster assembly protein [Tepidiformaceae bacterium]
MNEIEEATLILRDVIDPELGLDIVALGLVYAVDVSPDEVRVAMGTPAPMCPMGEVLLSSAEQVLRRRYPARAVTVELVSEPPW